jgi:hypothetical protein
LTAATAGVSGGAPADAYFGPFHVSPLAIRAKIDALGRSYHERSKSDHDIIHDAALAEAALRDWRNAYPDDPWLVRLAFALEQLFQAVQTAEARRHARAMLLYVATYWPQTYYGRTSRLRLRAGFTRLHGESPVQPTPNPYPRRTPRAPPPTPSASPRPSPASASPSPSPLPSGAGAVIPARSAARYGVSPGGSSR